MTKKRNETFTFTGTLSIKRSGASKMALSAGYRISRDVTSKTTVLVSGKLRHISRKMRKALMCNIPIMNENEFLSVIGASRQLYYDFISPEEMSRFPQ